MVKSAKKRAVDEDEDSVIEDKQQADEFDEVLETNISGLEADMDQDNLLGDVSGLEEKEETVAEVEETLEDGVDEELKDEGLVGIEEFPENEEAEQMND